MRGGWIELTYDCDVWNEKLDRYVPGKATMKCGSPADGVCLDKTYDKKIVDNWII
jgi:hypothetical protein